MKLEAGAFLVATSLVLSACGDEVGVDEDVADIKATALLPDEPGLVGGGACNMYGWAGGWYLGGVLHAYFIELCFKDGRTTCSVQPRPVGTPVNGGYDWGATLCANAGSPIFFGD